MSIDGHIRQLLEDYIEENNQEDNLLGEEVIVIGTITGSGFTSKEGGFGLSNAQNFHLSKLDEEGRLFDTTFVNLQQPYHLLPTISLAAETTEGTEEEVHKQVHVHELPLSVLRRFPIYLCDSMLLSDDILIPTDHYQYWAWTATYADNYFDSDTNLNSILSDFKVLVNMMLLPVVQSTLSTNTQRFIENTNPSISGVQKYKGLKMATSAGFPVLEGLLIRHLDELDDLNGKLSSSEAPKEGNYKITTRGFHTEEVSPNPYRPNYFQKLQMWMSNTQSADTKQALYAIDGLESQFTEKIGEVDLTDLDRSDFDRYDHSNLIKNLRGVTKGNLKGDAESLLHAISDLRNANIHGSDSTLAIGAIIMNLCCLAIWDNVEEDGFSKERDETLSRINTAPITDMDAKREEPYPLFRIWKYLQEKGLDQSLSQEMKISKMLLESDEFSEYFNSK